MPEYRESKMSPILEEYFKSLGYTVYCEVPYYYSPVDMVAENNGILIAIEMKVCLTKKVIRQAYMSNSYTPWCYAAVKSMPNKKSLNAAKHFGIGVIRVSDTVNIICDPIPFHAPFRRGKKMMDTLSAIEPGGIGGMPCIKGVGPAQFVFDAVEEYRITHPKATWKELYNNIKNHYCSYSSMYNAMRVVEYKRLTEKHNHDSCVTLIK